MRKKPRTAKQKANDKRLGRMAKNRAQKSKRKTTTRKRRTTRKGDKTLKGKKGYSRRKNSSDSDFDF